MKAERLRKRQWLVIRLPKCSSAICCWRTTDGQEIVPTVAGLLLFGRDERVAELLPRAAVTATRFSGDSLQSPVVERVKISGNLLSVYEGLTRFIRRYCDLSEVRPKNGARYGGRVAGAGAFELSPRRRG